MSEQMFERELILISRDEIVRQIPSRERSRQAEIERIERIGEAGGLIEGLAEGVCDHHVQAPAGVPQARLQRIVVRVPDSVVVIVVMEIRPERSARPVNDLAGGGDVGRVLSKRRLRRQYRELELQLAAGELAAHQQA